MNHMFYYPHERRYDRGGKEKIEAHGGRMQQLKIYTESWRGEY